MGLARALVQQRAHQKGSRLALAQAQAHIGDLDARIGCLHGLGQLQRRLQRAASRRVQHVGVEPVVDFMIPREHCSRQTGHDQEGREKQADPAMNHDPQSAHQKSTLAVSEKVRGAPWTR